MEIHSVFDEAFHPYGCAWAQVPPELTEPVVAALAASTPCPEGGTAYTPREPALEDLPVADELKATLFGGTDVQLGWCNGHNTCLNALEYHRSNEFNLGTHDFVLLLARRSEIEGAGCEATLDTARVQAFRVPAGVLVEVYATTLHYAPCQVDEDGFRVLVALPAGTNGPKPSLSERAAAAGDAPLLWVQDKWLLAHPASTEAAAGAHVGLVGENIDIGLR